MYLLFKVDLNILILATPKLRWSLLFVKMKGNM